MSTTDEKPKSTDLYQCKICLDLVFNDGYARWHRCGIGELKHVGLVIWDSVEQPSIKCPRCKKRSYHPDDIRQGYCGYCHWWTSDPMLGPYYESVYGPNSDH